MAAHPFHPLRGVARGHRPIGPMIPDLALDAIEVVNNAGVFSRLYDAWAALRNVEWMLPVTAGSDAHDVWYLGSAFTTFPGHDAARVAGGARGGADARPGGVVVDGGEDAAARAHPVAERDQVPTRRSPWTLMSGPDTRNRSFAGSSGGGASR